MTGKSTHSAEIKYHPSPENYAFLVDRQAEKKKTGPSVGLDRIVDQMVAKVRKTEDTSNQN